MAIKKSPAPWSYKKGRSPLHRLPAGIKLVFLLTLSLAAFFPAQNTPGLAIVGGIALILVVLSIIAGIGPWVLLRGSGPLFFIVMAVFLIQAVEFSPPGFKLDGLMESVLFCARIATAFATGSLYFSVTTSGETRKSLSRLEAFLHLEKLKVGFSISLMLGFIPSLFQFWEDINLAWKSRGGKKNLSRLVTLAPLLIERMMVKAAETATAMEARGALF